MTRGFLPLGLEAVLVCLVFWWVDLMCQAHEGGVLVLSVSLAGLIEWALGVA